MIARPGFVVGIALLLVAAVVSMWQHRVTATRLRSVRADTLLCERLAGEMRAIRELPRFAVLEAEPEDTIIDHIVRAAAAASIESRAISRIQPAPPIPTGAYEVRAVRTDVNNVTLRQVIQFMHQLAADERGITVRDLRMTEPPAARRGGNEEIWDVELTLTQLIFSPNSRPSPSLVPSSSTSAPAHEPARHLAEHSATAAGTAGGRRLHDSG